jgi:hypothetical protein
MWKRIDRGAGSCPGEKWLTVIEDARKPRKSECCRLLTMRNSLPPRRREFHGRGETASVSSVGVQEKHP